MQLTLEETAARMGKSVRQVRYLVKQGRLSAHKVKGRWVIDDDAIPLTPGQDEARARKQRQLRAAVEEGLGLTDAPPQQRYSVRDLKAYQIALPLYRLAGESLGADHPATCALHQVVHAAP